MNKQKMLAAVMAGGLAFSLALTGCGSGTASTETGKKADTSAKMQTTESQTQESLPEFVAADKTNWDKEVNIGSYAYTLKVTLNSDGTLELAGTCVGKAQEAVQQGPGGGGGSDPSATPAEDVPEPDEATKRSLDFKQSGTWTKDTGYGYILVLNDASVTTKTDFDKASSRHIFYLPVFANDASAGLVQFQGKDTAFRKEIASDYEDFEVRDAEITFTANGTTQTGNASTTNLWLEKDGTANCLVQSGSTPTYKRGMWTTDAATGNITVSLWGTDYTAIYCGTAGKEGYRVNYDGTLMYSNENVTYTDEDFDGKTVMTLLCGEGDYTLELTDKGYAVLRENGARSKDGSYTGSGDSLVVVLDGTTYAAEGGKLTVSWTSGSGSSASTVERVFNTDGTQPEAPAQGGEAPAQGEAPAEGEATSGGDAPAANG